MSVETIMAIIALLVSFISVISSFRKSQAEVYNLDAKTLKEYQDTIQEAHDNYGKLLEENEKMRIRFYDLDTYVRALINQLRNANIVPITKEEAIKLRNGG